MAQIGLTAVGTAIGGPIGGAIGSVVGAFVDSVLIGSLFPPETAEGPKVEDFRFNQVSEHAPVFKTFGPFNRVPGTYIWLSARDEVKIEDEVGGKGGGGQTVITYNYFFDMAVSVGKAPAGGVSNLLKVWGNSKVLWGFNENKDVTSNEFVATVEDEYAADGTTFLRRRMRVTSPPGAPKVNKFKSGVDVTMTSWPDANNNGTFRCLLAKKDPTTGGTYLEVENNDAVAESASPNAVNITQGLPQLQANGAADFVFYDGDELQTPSPLIEAAEGVGNVPGYRGTAYFTLERLLVNQFGNIPPQITALVEESAATTDADVIARILAEAGFSSGQYDITGLGEDNIDGYQVRGPTAVKEQLQPIMVKSDVVAQDRDGTLVFFYRADAPVVNVRTADLAAHESGRDAARPIEITDITGRDVPTTLDMRYYDAQFNYQSGSARAQTISKPYGETVQDINVPIVMLGTEAQDIVRRMLWTAHANQQRVRVALPPSYLATQENDRLRFTTLGKTWSVLLERVTRGSNFLIECEGIVEVDQLFLISGSESDEPTDPEPVGAYVPPELELFLMNLPPLTEEHATTSGIYVATAAFDATAQFLGATVYRSTIPISFYQSVLQVDTEATIGRTTSAHATAPNPDLVDRGTQLTVRLHQGTMTSVQFRNIIDGGVNVCVWGNEVFAFQNAALISADTWRLDTLLRGLFDTRDHMEHPNTGERFVLLNAPGVEFDTVPTLKIGTGESWKAVPALGAVADFPAQEFAPTSETLRPWAVMDVRASQVSAGDITLTWVRRERTPQGFLAFDIPVEDLDGMGYEVDVLDTPGGDVLRTLVASSETVVYTDAQQVIDFGSTQSTIHLAIFKLGASVGRGNEKAITVTPKQV